MWFILVGNNFCKRHPVLQFTFQSYQQTYTKICFVDQNSAYLSNIISVSTTYPCKSSTLVLY